MMPHVREIIGFAVIAIFAVVMGIYLLYPPVLDEGQSAVVNLLIGALIGSVTTVIGYHYGSSSSSKDKDDALAEIAKMPVNGHSVEVTVPQQDIEAEINKP